MGIAATAPPRRDAEASDQGELFCLEVTRRAPPTLSKAARRGPTRARQTALLKICARRNTRARNAALAVAAAAGVGIAALVWWARQQKKDSELDDEADAPPPPRTEEAPKDAASGEAVKAEFNSCKQKAFELFKASPPRYAEAAEWFSKAIDLSIAHETLAPQRKALYNNRSACRERCDDLEASLEDCAVVLASDPQHAKVRRRRARIFDKLGRNEEALVEICADLLIQREAFKKALQAGRQADQPTPVDNVESVMRARSARPPPRKCWRLVERLERSSACPRPTRSRNY